MKKLLILAILSIGLSVNAQSSSTNGSFWSITNLLAKFRYNGAGAFTNTITHSNTVNFASSNSYLSIAAYSNRFFVYDNIGNQYMIGSNGLLTVGYLTSPNIVAQALTFTTLTNNGVPGMTTNTLVSAPNSKTNLLQFSYGILTNVVNSY
jgi:hypothetical protein